MTAAPVAATIGMFDGVHRGHVWLIDRLKEFAARRGLGTAVVTFTNHPRNVLRPDAGMPLIMPLPRRIDLLAATGIDRIMLMDFTPELSMLDSAGFMELLSSHYGTAALLMGYNHRFGHNRDERFSDYVDCGRSLGIEVERADEYRGDFAPISSSIVRRLLNDGDVATAADKLGRHFGLCGTVVHGFARGRDIGFPTANVDVADTRLIVPRDGVYAVTVTLPDGSTHGGMANIGIRPTFNDGARRSIEIHIFGFDADIYGAEIEVRFIHRLRDERAMGSVEELKAQLCADLEAAKHRLSMHDNLNHPII